MAREITFPKTGDIWINAETGVWIERGFHNGGFGYIVRVPAWVGQRSYTTAAVKSYLRDAKATAHDVAEGMRAQIARAQREALVSFAIVMADRADASIAAATHEEALTGEEAHRLFSYLTTARLFRETDPERSIGWSNEILSELAKVADRETEAARSEATREQALAAWGQVWAGHVPTELPAAFKAGDYATVLRLAQEQIARQEPMERDLDRAQDQALEWIDAIGAHGSEEAARAEVQREATRLHLAREWYAQAGYATALLTSDIRAGYEDWDAGNASEGDQRDSFHAADLVLSSDQPEITNYLAGGVYQMALLAMKDTMLLVEHLAARHARAARPELLPTVEEFLGAQAFETAEPGARHGHGENWGGDSPGRARLYPGPY